jgi:hypothetical protein
MSFGWDYPPGVTGHEDAFGPEREYDDTFEVHHTCDEDRFDAPFEGEVFGTVRVWNESGPDFLYDCPQCGEEVLLELDA